MQYTKIIVPETSYDKASDSRLLIPFVKFGLIGFYNNKGDIVVEPQYTQYDGECYNDNDVVKVAKLITYGFHKGGDRVDTYHRHLWGLIDSKGQEILPLEYYDLIPAIGNQNLFTAKKQGAYSLINIQGEEIVPYGKYQYIDGLDNGLARVRVYINSEEPNKAMNKWGLINERGDEILPPIYDEIWNFYGKMRQTTKVVKNGITFDVFFYDLNPLLLPQMKQTNRRNNYCNYESRHYGEYAGSYAQDVMGYSDEDINDAFDGEADAYWNID